MTSQNPTLSLLNWQVAPESAPADDYRQMTADGLSIADLISQCERYDAHKKDYEIPATDFRLWPTGGFTCGSELSKRFTLEDGALVQMCARFGKPFYDGALPRDYTKALINDFPAEYGPILASHAAGYGKNVFVRTYGSGDGGSVRAFMSDRFTHIDNRDVLGILQEFLHNAKNGGRYSLVRPYVGRDELTIRVMIQTVRPQGSDSPYGVGCVIRTGEIGNVSPSIMPFIQRGVCTNSTVWQEGGIKLKQTGDRRNKLMLLIGAMGEAIQACPELLNRMIAAQYEQLPSLDSIIDGMAEKFEWSQEMTIAVARGTENQQTRAGLVNGLTYAAHAMELPAQKAVELEMLGGQMLFATEQQLHAFVPVR